MNEINGINTAASAFSTKKRFNKYHFIIVGGLFLAALIGFILSQYSYVEITINNSTNDPVSTNITSSNGSMVEDDNDSALIRKLLRRDDYLIKTSSQTGGTLKHISLPGFFQTKEVSITLQEKNQRVFVGDNPEACMTYVGAIISWPCRGSVNQSKIHNPGTNNQASSNNNLTIFGYSGFDAGGFISQNDDVYMLANMDFDGPRSVNVFSVDAADGVIDSTNAVYEIENPDPTLHYFIRNLDANIVIYDESGQNTEIISRDWNKQADLSNNSDGDERLYSISSWGDNIIAVYSDSFITEVASPSFFTSAKPGFDDEGLEGFDAEGGTTDSIEGFDEGRLVLWNNGEQREIQIDAPVFQLRLCGHDLLCGLHEEKLTVYDISDDSLNKQYSIADVLQIESNNESFYVVTHSGVYSFDAGSGLGAKMYYIDGYSYCGMRALQDNIILCIDDGLQTTRSRSLIRVNITETMQEPIDKKILTLKQAEFIDVLSVYENNIYISPLLTSNIYNESIGRFEYDQEEINEVNQKIQAKISDLDIDTSQYNIVNPFN